MDDAVRGFSAEGILAMRPVDNGGGDVCVGLLQDIDEFTEYRELAPADPAEFELVMEPVAIAYITDGSHQLSRFANFDRAHYEEAAAARLTMLSST